MSDIDALRDTLSEIDGRGYNGYHEIKGDWRFPGWTLVVDWVQGDPFAAPSRVRALVPPDSAALPRETLASASRRLGVAACLARAFSQAAREASKSRGSGRSGTLHMESPGQIVVEQTAVMVAEDGAVEARFGVGLPARGRRILGSEATRMLLDVVPALVEDTLLEGAHEPEVLVHAAEVNEDADALRDALDGLDLVAFVADDARLPRRSGIDDRPLGEGVVPFRSPERLRVEVDLPNRGTVTGMGIPRGVTLIVGGGFHGKSTLLGALEMGVYNHAPDDGRELVVSSPNAVKIRAEDGRAVSGDDISAFIDGLPRETDTRSFSTVNASGSTSQAAALVEALEVGADALLVDEDTAATNFMIRDRRMQALVPKEGEPITPFVDRVRDLHERGVSTILVIGGSGDYLDVADVVIAMRDYLPEDVSEDARAVAERLPTGRSPETGPPIATRVERVPERGSLDPRRGKRKVSLKVPDRRTIVIGTTEIDLSALEQLTTRGQTQAIAVALVWIHENVLDGERTVPEIVDAVLERVDREGLDGLQAGRRDLARFRRFELAGALNRARSLSVRTSRKPRD